ncbi:retrovirus-related pol polyprotein from transposon TNT 1-94, partial [Tanacetum coccineum]
MGSLLAKYEKLQMTNPSSLSLRRKVEESLNVTFDETPPHSKTSPLVDDDLDEEEAIKVTEKKNLENDIMDETLEIDEIVNIKESKNHPLENVIRNLNQRTLRSQAQNQSNFFCFISTIKPKNVNEALTDDSWIVAMQEELNQFIANDVWELVLQPRNMTIIGTKWVFRNKLDENGIISQNKARLVGSRGYQQEAAIDLSAFVPASKRLPKPLTLKRLNVYFNTLKNSKESSWKGFAAVLAVLITETSKGRQHGMSEPIPPVLAGSWEQIPILNHLITPIK